jgi:predicted RNA-binding Zn-ribbon protein involved in translation (DUF1610 family)
MYEGSIGQFITDHVKLAPESRVPQADLYQEYERYCLEREQSPEGKHAFTGELKALPGVELKQARWLGRSCPVWHGLEYQDVIPDEEKKKKNMQRTLEDALNTLSNLEHVVAGLQQQLTAVQEQLAQRSRAEIFKCATCGEEFTNIMAKAQHERECEKKYKQQEEQEAK